MDPKRAGGLEELEELVPRLPAGSAMEPGSVKVKALETATAMDWTQPRGKATLMLWQPAGPATIQPERRCFQLDLPAVEKRHC